MALTLIGVALFFMDIYRRSDCSFSVKANICYNEENTIKKGDEYGVNKSRAAIV